MDHLKILLTFLEETEILQVFDDLPNDAQVIIFRLLAKEKALSIFEMLDTTLQQKLLQSFKNGRAKEIINEMAPDDRVRLLDELPADVAKKIIDSLSTEERKATNLLMGYEPKNAIWVSTDTDQEVVAKTLQDFDLLAIPVVDKEGLLVGIVTIDDAVDIFEDEATEDILYQAGIVGVTNRESDRSEVLIQGSLWKIWKVRLPFLLITLAAGMLAGVVVAGFEETLEAIAAVAIFIPLIMDMGGNVGTQSSTVFVRGVVLEHININKFVRHLLKEAGIGFSMGILIGVAAGIIASIWQGMPMLGIAVGLSLVFTMTLASLLGFLIPFVLIKLNVDQAAGSAPIITSIKDVAGLIIYFLLVIVFMGHMM